MTRDRKAATLNNDQRLKLISFVHLNECLWKNSKEGCKASGRSTALWQKFITDNKLECTINELKQHWQNLRNNFSKKYKANEQANEQSNGSLAHEQENWPFYKHLMFIRTSEQSDLEDYSLFNVEYDLLNNDYGLLNEKPSDEQTDARDNSDGDMQSIDSGVKNNNLKKSSINMNESSISRKEEDETGNEAFAQYILKQLNLLKEDQKSLRRLRHNIENTIFNFFEENE